MERTFLKALDALLERPCKGVLLGVSGGVDSMVLSHLFLHHGGVPLAIAHMNFGLRGADSLADEAFVSRWAHHAGIPFYCKRVPTRSYAAAHGISIEMAARELRYEWFYELLAQLNFSTLALAHQANDQAETLLLHLTRGTGIKGLCGMPQKTPRLIRPLLEVSRKEIEAYAATHGIAYRVDRTNTNPVFARNRLRHHVLPQLEQINPSVVARLSKNAQYIRQAHTLLARLEAQKWEEVCLDPNPQGLRLSIAALQKEGVPEYWCHAFLSRYGFGQEQTQAIGRALAGPSGKRFYSATHLLWVEREQLVIKPLLCREEVLDPGGAAHGLPQVACRLVEVSAQAPYVVIKDPRVACLDAHQLSFPLQLRRWQPGDTFRPFGMKGRKKVSDYLIDAKVPPSQKEDVCVLCTATGEIAWLVGFRVDGRFAVTPATTQVWEGRWV